MSASVRLKRRSTANRKGVDWPCLQVEMENPMSSGILQEKNAVVFGAGGSIGAAVAKEFAAEGAKVFLAGRTQSSVMETGNTRWT
jgi:shikimate 5-dehydrogenase